MNESNELLINNDELGIKKRLPSFPRAAWECSLDRACGLVCGSGEGMAHE